MADRFTAAGLDVLPPQAAFYLYPSFGPRRAALDARDGLTTDASLASHLLDRYGMGVLSASVFGDNAGALRIRVATGLLYGDTDAHRECAPASPTQSRFPGSPRRWTGWRRSWVISPWSPRGPLAPSIMQHVAGRLGGMTVGPGPGQSGHRPAGPQFLGLLELRRGARALRLEGDGPGRL